MARGWAMGGGYSGAGQQGEERTPSKGCAHGQAGLAQSHVLLQVPGQRGPRLLPTRLQEPRAQPQPCPPFSPARLESWEAGGQDGADWKWVGRVLPRWEHGPGTPLCGAGPCRHTLKSHLLSHICCGVRGPPVPTGREAGDTSLEAQLWDNCPSGPSLDHQLGGQPHHRHLAPQAPLGKCTCGRAMPPREAGTCLAVRAVLEPAPQPHASPFAVVGAPSPIPACTLRLRALQGPRKGCRQSGRPLSRHSSPISFHLFPHVPHEASEPLFARAGPSAWTACSPLFERLA